MKKPVRMDCLELAKKCALAAGRIHKKYFQGKFKISTKASSFDLVTAADLEAEDEVVSLIKKYYPGHNFLAEERKYPETASKFTWIIDPLDGTNNFSSGLPIFCASVAFAYEDEVIAAAVYDVTRNELFYAAKGKGAFLNGRRIKVNNAGSLKQAILVTGFYYSRGREMIQTLAAMKRFLHKHIIGLRRFGAAALDLCYVAGGRVSGFWEFKLSPWDFAAGKLIIEEAGGRVSGRHGEEAPLKRKYYIVASNKKIHNQMLEVLNQTR